MSRGKRKLQDIGEGKRLRERMRKRKGERESPSKALPELEVLSVTSKEQPQREPLFSTLVHLLLCTRNAFVFIYKRRFI